MRNSICLILLATSTVTLAFEPLAKAADTNSGSSGGHVLLALSKGAHTLSIVDLLL